VKLPAHSVRTGPARSGERDASKRNIVFIVLLSPAYPALAGRGTFRSKRMVSPEMVEIELSIPCIRAKMIEYKLLHCLLSGISASKINLL
jgi:hypothetical protein